MNTALKWKLTVGFLLAFLAGGATGGFFAASQARHLRAHPHPWLVERMRGRIQTELDLTPEQVEKTAPIFNHAASELEKVGPVDEELVVARVRDQLRLRVFFFPEDQSSAVLVDVEAVLDDR